MRRKWTFLSPCRRVCFILRRTRKNNANRRHGRFFSPCARSYTRFTIYIKLTYLNLGKDVEETNATLARGCKLGDQFYKSGSSWHPYLTDGFDTCVVCTCDALSLEISCPRTQCPPLTCSEKVAYRPDKKSCCKRCPEVRIDTHSADHFRI